MPGVLWYIETNYNLPGGGILCEEPMWEFDVNYVIQNNRYVQLLATLCVFQPLLRDLLKTSTERFVKRAGVCDFCGAKISL